MAEIQHRDIQDPEIHEPRGIIAAAPGRVYVADGNGTGSWQRVDPSDLKNNTADWLTPGGNLVVNANGGIGTSSGVSSVRIVCPSQNPSVLRDTWYNTSSAWIEVHNEGGMFVKNGGILTAPVTGIYYVGCHFYIDGGSNETTWRLRSSSDYNLTGNTVNKLSSGESIRIQFLRYNNSGSRPVTYYSAYFSLTLITEI